MDLEAYDPGVRAAIAGGRLAALSPAVLGRLTESSVLTVIPGRALYPYDPRSQILALVVEGLLRTFVLAADGRQITLRYSRPGALAGAASLYAENSVFVQVQALVDTRLLLLRPAQVRALATAEASVANMLLHELGERTNAYMELIAATGLSSVRQKVVRHLLDLAAEGSSGELVAHLTQQELAHHVGTVREVVARILRDLREDGLINTSRDQIVLVDPTRLHAQTWPGNG